jgi:hypothetical protein
MVRNYEFTWYPTKEKKYGIPVIRTNMIKLSHPIGKTAVDTKSAVEIFSKSFGNLNKNTIVTIREYDENGQIGEDITPAEGENAIIPVKR